MFFRSVALWFKSRLRSKPLRRSIPFLRSRPVLLSTGGSCESFFCRLGFDSFSFLPGSRISDSSDGNGFKNSLWSLQVDGGFSKTRHWNPTFSLLAGRRKGGYLACLIQSLRGRKRIRLGIVVRFAPCMIIALQYPCKSWRQIWNQKNINNY